MKTTKQPVLTPNEIKRLARYANAAYQAIAGDLPLRNSRADIVDCIFGSGEGYMMDYGFQPMRDKHALTEIREFVTYCFERLRTLRWDSAPRKAIMKQIFPHSHYEGGGYTC